MSDAIKTPEVGEKVQLLLPSGRAVDGKVVHLVDGESITLDDGWTYVGFIAWKVVG
jgi:hypothetical protein